MYRYHFDLSRLGRNNTFAGLLGGHLPALRWHYPIDVLAEPTASSPARPPPASPSSTAVGSDGWVEQIAFAVPESTPEAPFDVSAVQPVWIRYINVTADGALRYVHYVDTFEQCE